MVIVQLFFQIQSRPKNLEQKEWSLSIMFSYSKQTREVGAKRLVIVQLFFHIQSRPENLELKEWSLYNYVFIFKVDQRIWSLKNGHCTVMFSYSK